MGINGYKQVTRMFNKEAVWQSNQTAYLSKRHIREEWGECWVALLMKHSEEWSTLQLEGVFMKVLWEEGKSRFWCRSGLPIKPPESSNSYPTDGV